MKRVLTLALALVLVCAARSALAHKPSDSYLAITVGDARFSGQWDIALRDLDYALGLDSDGDGKITWGELRAKHAEIASYASGRLKVSADGRRCTLAPTAHLVDDHSDGAYEVLQFSIECGRQKPVREVEVDYTLFFDLDPSHRGMLRIQHPGGTRTAILSPDRPKQSFALAEPSRLAQFIDYGREGIWHILIGFDHILFLISLLLPAVFFLAHGRSSRQWEPALRFAPVFWDVLKIVTAFTLAHSVTLSLAALSVISLPTRLVESTIAFSVMLAALNNLWPVVVGRRWAVAFGFGLVHGFGFASVLADLGLPRDALVLSLVGFNVGVEIGQLAIVAAFLPIAYALRRSALYRRMIFTGGSALIALIAAIWMAERVFVLKLMPI